MKEYFSKIAATKAQNFPITLRNIRIKNNPFFNIFFETSTLILKASGRFNSDKY